MHALDQQYFTRPAAQGGDFDALRFELGQLPSEKDLAVPLLTWLKEEEAEKDAARDHILRRLKRELDDKHDVLVQGMKNGQISTPLRLYLLMLQTKAILP